MGILDQALEEIFETAKARWTASEPEARRWSDNISYQSAAAVERYERQPALVRMIDNLSPFDPDGLNAMICLWQVMLGERSYYVDSSGARLGDVGEATRQFFNKHLGEIEMASLFNPWDGAGCGSADPVDVLSATLKAYEKFASPDLALSLRELLCGRKRIGDLSPDALEEALRLQFLMKPDSSASFKHRRLPSEYTDRGNYAVVPGIRELFKRVMKREGNAPDR